MALPFAYGSCISKFILFYANGDLLLTLLQQRATTTSPSMAVWAVAAGFVATTGGYLTWKNTMHNPVLAEAKYAGTVEGE